MIKLERREGMTCPLVICDACGDEIREYRDANVTWDSALEMRHVHRQCDTARDGRSWESLAWHLHDLCFNVHLKPEDLMQIARDRKEWPL